MIDDLTVIYGGAIKIDDDLTEICAETKIDDDLTVIYGGAIKIDGDLAVILRRLNWGDPGSCKHLYNLCYLPRNL